MESEIKSGELPLSTAKDAVFIKSVDYSDGLSVEGFDFNEGICYEKILLSYKRTGFQALNFGRAVEEILKMLHVRDELPVSVSEFIDEMYRPKTNCTIFLGYTSNMASSGIRDIIRYLVEHKLVDVLVTTAGGIEEDFIKCMAPTYLGDFNLKGESLRRQGLNRTGNLIVPNTNYCLFEEWFQPILDEMLEEQNKNNFNWTPSKMIAKMGKIINNPKSIYYWAYKNDIPVFSPAITDGSIGDNIYFHSYRHPGLRIDIAEDIRKINNLAVYAKNTGQIIIGGGLIKHHICNANLMRNGADFSLYINTSCEYDGSDSGAGPDEAVSWGKIKVNATPVKIFGDATLIFPILVAETFAKYVEKKKNNKL
ncbi:deoxyhypusine synthase [Hydra vulgaris]|uniref:deoxyhypusine synthase n=1 Tax=Hydra vulgaris TaxID=6087 RepID=T2MG28_HYDVU|nr:deoxyhypusine synthase-like [Hydra vulgaris]